MTIVGKVLVFLNLLLSVATCYLIVLIFHTRSNWKAEYEKYKNYSQVGEKAYQGSATGRDSETNSLASQIKAAEEEKKSLVAQLKDAVVKIDDLNLQLAKQKQENATAVQTHANLNEEVASLKKERDLIQKDLVALRAKILETQKELNDQKLLAVNNRIEADSEKAQKFRLLNRVEELEKNLTVVMNRLRSLGADVVGSRESLLNPPPIAAPRDVKGTVMAVNTQGLMVVNIGSDSGLSAGNKLEVYRTDLQNPKNSIYLGELVIGRTEPKQASGQFFPKSSARGDERLPRNGDQVSTSLGSR